jgi:hypothetical protein
VSVEDAPDAPGPHPLLADPFTFVYHDLCEQVLAGDRVTIRGQETRELVAVQAVIDPYHPLADRPGFSETFALLETLQVICGRGDLHQLARHAPRFPQLAPSYVTYGPRLGWQLREVVHMLEAHPEARGAVAQVHAPEDLRKGYPDQPCTLSLQFLVREDRLHLIATMRSNDIWFGTPNDVFMFTFFQREVAAALNLHAGHYVHQAGSLHVYPEHVGRLTEVAVGWQPPREASLPILPGASAVDRWDWLRGYADRYLTLEHAGDARSWWEWLRTTD